MKCSLVARGRSLLTAGGWLVLTVVPARPSAVESTVPIRPSARVPSWPARCLDASMMGPQHDEFDVCVDLGEGSGRAQIQLQPYFTDSDLVTVRLPLPFALEADQKDATPVIRS